jgi:hypothetical protein
MTTRCGGFDYLRSRALHAEEDGETDVPRASLQDIPSLLLDFWVRFKAGGSEAGRAFGEIHIPNGVSYLKRLGSDIWPTSSVVKGVSFAGGMFVIMFFSLSTFFTI